MGTAGPPGAEMGARKPDHQDLIGHRGKPSVDDLATLLAHAMRRPRWSITRGRIA